MRHYFLRGVFVGSCKPTLQTVCGQRQIPNGRAFFCPVCSEVWLLAPVDSQETFVDHVLCAKHSSTPSRKAGHFYLSWDEEWNKDLPTELLELEFLLLYKEKENGTAI
jgi:hypothetical protein